RRRNPSPPAPPGCRRAQSRAHGRAGSATRRRTPAARQDPQVCGARSSPARAGRAWAHRVDAGRGGGVRARRVRGPHLGVPDRSEPHPHARRIAQETGATLRVVVDDLGTARALAGSGLHVWLKVDCGYHRAGVDPTSPYAVEVARELGAERQLVFDGILSHSGHAYRTTSEAEAARVAEEERSIMVGFAGRLREQGVPVREVSVGSTPAMAAVLDLAGVTEARPGNYLFYDRTMVLIGCCEPADVGVTVLATVVSHQPGASHFIVDAGALELSKDPGP